MIHIGVLGSKGRMGEWVTRLLSGEFQNQAQVSATADRGDSIESLLRQDAVIDFSSPEAMTALASAAIAQPHGTRLPVFVVGSTGWTKESLALLDALAKRTPVLMASNFSTGVLALQEILKTAAPMLKRLGYTPVLVDTHHRHKKDAPSGTARTLQRIISPDNDVQTHSVRAGEVIGDHEITFYGPGDHLTLGHFAQDRSIFARGAIDCALWMASHRDKTVKAGALIDISAFFSSTGGER